MSFSGVEEIRMPLVVRIGLMALPVLSLSGIEFVLLPRDDPIEVTVNLSSNDEADVVVLSLPRDEKVILSLSETLRVVVLSFAGTVEDAVSSKTLELPVLSLSKVWEELFESTIFDDMVGFDVSELNVGGIGNTETVLLI